MWVDEFLIISMSAKGKKWYRISESDGVRHEWSWACWRVCLYVEYNSAKWDSVPCIIGDYELRGVCELLC